MATVIGVVATIIAAPPSPATWLTAGYIDGRVKLSLDFYVALGTEGAATIIKMGQLLPVGAKVLWIDIATSASTGGLTISVGDLDSATRYASASTGPATLGTTRIGPKLDSTNGYYVIGSNPATPTTTDNDQQIILTTGGATLSVGTIVSCAVYYTTD